MNQDDGIYLYITDEKIKRNDDELIRMIETPIEQYEPSLVLPVLHLIASTGREVVCLVFNNQVKIYVFSSGRLQTMWVMDTIEDEMRARDKAVRMVIDNEDPRWA